MTENLTPQSERPEPSPPEVAALIYEADILHSRVLNLQQRLQGSRDLRHLGTRLDGAARNLREVNAALGLTARELTLACAARDPEMCGVPGGVCPEHGTTLRGTGSHSWCTTASCERTWDYDRLRLPCSEPATHQIAWVTEEGVRLEYFVCVGHSMPVLRQVRGGLVARIDLFGPQTRVD